MVIESEMEAYFLDHLTTGEKYPQSKEELWNFVKGLGYLFSELYRYLFMLLVQSNSSIDLSLQKKSKYFPTITKCANTSL